MDALRGVSFGLQETQRYDPDSEPSRPWGDPPQHPAPGSHWGQPATATPAPKKTTTAAAKPGSSARGVLFDTAAGDSVLPLALAEKRTPLPGLKGPALETASGEPIQSAGEVYSVDFVTGGKLLPGRLTAANVVQPILAAAHYCGPGGDYRATLDAKNPHLLHLPTKETYPLR